EYDLRFGVLINIVKYFNYYTINTAKPRRHNKIINLGIDSIYIILPNFVADLIK
ncbi:hypothetical protein GE21DRAFT_1223716, partial [Neurospora crassa]